MIPVTVFHNFSSNVLLPVTRCVNFLPHFVTTVTFCNTCYTFWYFFLSYFVIITERTGSQDKWSHILGTRNKILWYITQDYGLGSWIENQDPYSGGSVIQDQRPGICDQRPGSIWHTVWTCIVATIFVKWEYLLQINIDNVNNDSKE